MLPSVIGAGSDGIERDFRDGLSRGYCPGEQRDRFDKACADEWLVLDEIVASIPTTLAGVADVLRYFAARADRDAFREQELIETLLGNMATALDRIEAGRLS